MQNERRFYVFSTKDEADGRYFGDPVEAKQYYNKLIMERKREKDCRIYLNDNDASPAKYTRHEVV